MFNLGDIVGIKSKEELRNIDWNKEVRDIDYQLDICFFELEEYPENEYIVTDFYWGPENGYLITPSNELDGDSFWLSESFLTKK